MGMCVFETLLPKFVDTRHVMQFRSVLPPRVGSQILHKLGMHVDKMFDVGRVCHYERSFCLRFVSGLPCYDRASKYGHIIPGMTV